MRDAAALIPDALGIGCLPVDIDALAADDLVFIRPKGEIRRRMVGLINSDGE